MATKISVIIPFTSDKDNIERSFDSLEKQVETDAEVEVIVVCNRISETGQERALELEKKRPDSVIIVNVSEECSYADLLNEGLQYFNGDYFLFLMAGDCLNKHFMRGIEDIANDQASEIISFACTEVMERFELFDDEPLAYDSFWSYDLSKEVTRKRFLASPKIDERFFCSAYKREFWERYLTGFVDDCIPDDMTFVYQLLFYADRVAVIQDHGYCRYKKDSGAKSPAVIITGKMTAQSGLLERLQSDKDLFEQYKDPILAHFLRKYYLDNIYFGMASKNGRALSLDIFKVLQYVCNSLIPDWIYNEYVYSFGRNELSYLSWLTKQNITEDELYQLINEKALVSVIITTYNRQDCIGDAIDNILSQTWQNFELIIVNDGSKDDTDKIVGSYSDDRIHYIVNSPNRGVSYSRNTGASVASGTFLVYQDDDDHSRLDKIEKQVKYLLNAPENIGMVYHETINHKALLHGIKDSSTIIPDRKMSDVKKEGFIYPSLLPKNFVACTSMLFKKELFDSVDGFDESLVAYEDWEFTLRFCKRYDIGFIKEVLYDYYQGDEGLISSEDDKHRLQVITALAEIDRRFKTDQKAYGIRSLFVISEKSITAP